MNRDILKEIIPFDEFKQLYVDMDLSYDEIAEKLNDKNITSSALRHLNSEEYHCKKLKSNVLLKSKQTKMAKYGNPYYVNKEKIKESLNNKTKEEWKQIAEDRKQTMLNVYGVEHQMQLESTKEKIKQTNLEKYGVDNPFKSKDFNKKYHVKKSQKAQVIQKPKHILTQSEIEERKLKRKQSNLLKYGTEWPQQSDIVKEKIRKTNIERYGGPAPIYNAEVKKNIFKNKSLGLNIKCNRNKYDFDIMQNKEKLLEVILSIPKENRTLNILSEELQYDKTYVDAKILEFGLSDYVTKISSRSYYEDELVKFLNSIGITDNIELNNKTILSGKEIDIYLPDFQLGIEFNGNYWHCDLQEKMQDNGGRSLYHQNKSLEALKNGVFLYHIFEYEWNNEELKNKILNHLKTILNRNTIKVYARNCQIKEISNIIKRDFLNLHHIQGNDNSQINLGLYYNDDLVSVMTFCKARFTTSCNWELSRFCSKTDLNVCGGANKLFKYFLDNYVKNNETIVSYSNIAKTTGKVYEKMGFEFSNISQPNYVWWNSMKHDVLSRYQTRMKNETIVMHEKAYHRICDCGNKVWIYTKK